MLSGGSGRFPRPEKREPTPKGQCPSCGVTVPLVRTEDGGLVFSIHAPFAARCSGSGGVFAGW